MSLNDLEISNQTAKSTATYAGVANPTKSGATDPISSNFVNDPTTPTLGAGAPHDFDGHKHAARQLRTQAGVIEARPGIIESTNIDPLNENSNKDDGWANVKPTSSVSRAADSGKSYAASAADVITGATKLAYGTLMGDEDTKKAGQEAVFGK